MTDIRVEHGSLTEGDASVLVNASNTEGNLGSGVSAAISRACGPGFQAVIHAALRERWGGSMEPGQVLVTHAGQHPRARHVVHVAVMDYRQGFTGASYPSLALVEAACARVWRAVEELPGDGPHGVAMVALGAGTGGLGARDSSDVACRTLVDHLRENPHTRVSRVTFHGYELPDYLAMVDVAARHFGWAALQVPDDVAQAVKRLHG